jgi:cytoskeletal protein RodZ
MVEEQTGQLAAGVPALSVGALLAEARAAKGRELAEVARETRVPLRHLMAIEADDHEALPALPYALGFVKAFARAVGLDAEAIGARFRAETRLAPHVPTPSSLEPVDEARLPSRGLTFAALGALVLVLGGLGLYGAGVFDPEPPRVAVAPAPPAEPPSMAAEAAPAGSAAPTAQTGAAGQSPTAVPPAAVSPPATVAPPASGEVVLTAREDVWLRVTDRATGKRAFMGVLSTGQSWTVPSGGPHVMRTGRAGVIDIRIAGRLLPPLGQRNQTIDGVVLSAQALAERFAGQALPAPPVQPGARPVAAQAERRSPSPAT